MQIHINGIFYEIVSHYFVYQFESAYFPLKQDIISEKFLQQL